MSDAQIFDDFAQLVTAFAAQSSPPIPVSYPAIPFTPPADALWLELTWVPNRSTEYGMDDEGPTLMQGLAQVSVCYRPGAGILGGLGVAEALINALPKGTIFGDARTEGRAWVSGVIEDPDRIAHPVTIPWRAMV